MKALSIIGIVMSLIGILYSVTIMTTPDTYKIPDFALLVLIVVVYFLAFSIITVVQAFKKKKSV